MLGVAVLSLAVLVLIQRGVLKELYTAAGIFAAVGLLTVLVEASDQPVYPAVVSPAVVVVFAHFLHGDGAWCW